MNTEVYGTIVDTEPGIINSYDTVKITMSEYDTGKIYTFYELEEEYFSYWTDHEYPDTLMTVVMEPVIINTKVTVESIDKVVQVLY